MQAGVQTFRQGTEPAHEYVHEVLESLPRSVSMGALAHTSARRPRLTLTSSRTGRSLQALVPVVTTCSHYL